MKLKTRLIAVTCLYLLLIAWQAHGETINLNSADNKTIGADYLQGDDDHSPVILLHGFLQTRDFPTVSRLATALHESGHSVLNPSLSLGISNRKQSLACEAIHTHSLDSDAAELKQWVDWMWKKNHKPVILIGHSSGGPVILRYMENTSARFVRQAILISLAHYGPGPAANETSAEAIKARQLSGRQAEQLDNYALRYCKTYPTSAKAFLSYYDWDAMRVSKALKKFNEKTAVIIGSDDKRIEDSWRQLLLKEHKNAVSIQGANHFFDQAHEFDLIDAIETILKAGPEH